jgi:hypothetical protein
VSGGPPESLAAYTELLADKEGHNLQLFPAPGRRRFEWQGLTISLVMTDNGSGYRLHLFLTVCYSLGAKPIKAKPYTPHTNRQG